MLASAQLFCAVVGTLMVIVFPKITQLIIDEVIPNKQTERLVPLVLIGLGAFFARDFLNAMRILVNNVFEQKVIYDLRSDLYDKIQRLPLRWFDNRPTGDIMTRVGEDVQAMERVLIDGIEQGMVALLQIAVVAFFMFSMNATLAAMALIPIPFLVIGATWYTMTARDRYRENRKATSDMNSLLHDNIAGIRQIKTYTMEAEEHGRFNRASERVRQATLRIMRAWAAYNPAMSFFGAAGSVIVIGFGAKLVLEGNLDDGELVMFLFLLALFYEPIGKLHSLNQLIQSGRAAGERVFEILDSEEEANMHDGDPLGEVSGHVVYDNVSFSYTDRMPTLSGVNLEAKPGQTIALVGPTGAGKSTIINLLTRFYEHDEGTISIDGRCVSGLKKDGLREAIGYVTQESFLFNGTVRENLVIADREADDAALWEALEIANADTFIRKLPDGLDTHVGERGVKLSVGEKQRVSIARALLKNPPILLLDEATASVDTETERLIQEALERLMMNRTSFVIAHRLSTVRNADRIYVLSGGEIAEQGTHDELLELGGIYAELCKTSFLDEADAQ
jgi:ATP-binding cassette subfamily B protein/subfamily B ATP-binding cassette protein MsbA